MINKKNKKRLVSFCYFFTRLNNKFINRVKVEVRFLLDQFEVSLLIIEILASANLTIRHKTIARQKTQYIELHMVIIRKFLLDNISI